MSRNLRLFTAATDGWTEITSGGGLAVRLLAPDLQRARRELARLRAAGAQPEVILDVTVAIAENFRAARRVLGTAARDSVHYVGTVNGLAGLVEDIVAAGVADGVTLVPAADGQDVGALGLAVLERLERGSVGQNPGTGSYRPEGRRGLPSTPSYQLS